MTCLHLMVLYAVDGMVPMHADDVDVMWYSGGDGILSPSIQ
jgi:hypothetical protein